MRVADNYCRKSFPANIANAFLPDLGPDTADLAASGGAGEDGGLKMIAAHCLVFSLRLE